MDDLLDLSEAAALLGIKAPSLRKRLNSTGKDAIPGVKVKLGERDVWRVRRATIDALLSGSPSDYDQILARWQAEQANGIHSGRHVGHRRIENNLYGLECFWRYLDEPPSLRAVTPENLQRALAAVPVDYRDKNCHYGIRDNLYKGVTSLTKLLVRIGVRSAADLAEMKRYMPRRIFPPKRTNLKPEQLAALLQKNESIRGRTAYDSQLLKTAILLMALAGLRRAEVLNLEVGHLDLDRAELWVRDGKGHKDGLVGMPPDLVQQLRQWLETRKPSRHPHVLVRRDGERVKPNDLQLRLRRLAQDTGIDITLHGLRRTCATLMVDSGVPLVHVQRNLRHSQISTTMAYVQTDQQTAAESFKRFSLGSLSGIPTNSPAPPPADAPVKPDAVLGFVKAKRGKK